MWLIYTNKIKGQIRDFVNNNLPNLIRICLKKIKCHLIRFCFAFGCFIKKMLNYN